jgi:hypothetical protein
VLSTLNDCAGADPQTDYQNRKQSETWIASKNAKRVTKILEQGINERQSSGIAMFLSQANDVAHFQPRLSDCFVG